MRKPKTLLVLLLIAGAGGGALYAQNGDGEGDKKPDPDGKDLPEATIAGEKDADLSPREMATEGKRLIGEMEGHHTRTLELQGAARKAKDVIKLNCVNEKLLAVKQLLNIAESAENDLTEAIASADDAEQLHQYTQVKFAHERSTASRDEAEGCIGEEIIFVGPTEVSVTGPLMPDDPTDDPDQLQVIGSTEIEHGVYASPWF